MLPILAVLLIAQGAVAAPPSVAVNAYPVNEYQIVPDNSRLVSSYLVNGVSVYADEADKPFYLILLNSILSDMANSNDANTQAAAVLGTVASIGEIVSGLPGDSCESAALINSYAYARSSGNSAGVKQAVSSYVGRLSTYLDLIVQLIVNPNSVKYAIGPRGSCLGGGRTYQFEEAWNSILESCNAYQIGYLNEVYCAARRMYNAFSITSNNVAAATTAVSIPQFNQIGKTCLTELANVLRSAANGGDPTQAAAVAKSCLANAVPQVSY